MASVRRFGKEEKMKTRVLFAAVVSLLLTRGYAQTTDADVAADKSPHKSGFVKVNGVRLHFLDWGGNGDWLLLLTGSGDDAHIFDSFAPKLIEGFHVVGLTRRGFGESDKPRTGYDTGTLVEDVRGFLDAMKITSVAIVGHSVAGTEMTMLASQYPGRVTKLVYLDAAYDYTCKAGTEPVTWETSSLPTAALAENSSAFDPWTVLNKESDLYHPTYSKVRVPALAIYSPPERHPEKPWNATPERRKEMDAWWLRNRYPCTRSSIEQFRKDMAQGKIVELQKGWHYVFMMPTEDEVAHRTREFLLSDKLK
jgi:pimeloyl-ACP methyl ester carboxylesterase